MIPYADDSDWERFPGKQKTPTSVTAWTPIQLSKGRGPDGNEASSCTLASATPEPLRAKTSDVNTWILQTRLSRITLLLESRAGRYETDVYVASWGSRHDGPGTSESHH